MARKIKDGDLVEVENRSHGQYGQRGRVVSICNCNTQHCTVKFESGQTVSGIEGHKLRVAGTTISSNPSHTNKMLAEFLGHD